MKISRLILILNAVIVMGMIGCSKKGDQGPAGPRGPAGPDSVVYSQWIILNSTYNADDTLFEDTLSAPSITQSILDSGVILTYVNFQASNGTYHVIPVSSLNYLMSEDYSLGQINIIATSDVTGLPYRYVTIPGSKIAGNKTSGTIQGHSIQELKTLPLTEVQKIVGTGGN